MVLNLRKLNRLIVPIIYLGVTLLMTPVYFTNLSFKLSTSSNWSIFTYLFPLTILAINIVWIFVIVRAKRILKKRTVNLTVAAFKSGMNVSEFSVSPTLLDLCKRDWKLKNSFSSTDWGYGDFEFYVYRKTKYGEYISKTIYYSIAYFNLPRVLPNVFLDSHKTGKREFKSLFTSDQRHSLEGNFDKYFDTYFGQGYTVDSLSFISPEVMQAMIDASEYDIEIYKDKLYLYNELEDMPKQLEDVKQKGFMVRDKLLNNISSYRDERIDYDDGRKTVSITGIKLQRSLIKLYLAVGLEILLSIIIVIMSIFDKTHLVLIEYAIFPLFPLIPTVLKIKSELQDRSNLRTSGHAAYRSSGVS